MPTTELPLPKKERYTYADYQELPEGAPYELIHGVLRMSPSPAIRHQRITRILSRILDQHVTNDALGEIFFAPTDVHLSDKDVVQPDLLFVASENEEQIGEQAVEGAPDLVMEVVSPSTAGRDAIDKKRLYEQHGVREYWIVDPDTRSVEVWTHDGDGFTLHVRRVDDGVAASALLDGMAVDLETLFST